MDYKVIKRRKPIILKSGKVKRIGKTYYELARWAGNRWVFSEYNSIKDVNNKIKELENV